MSAASDMLRKSRAQLLETAHEARRAAETHERQAVECREVADRDEQAANELGMVADYLDAHPAPPEPS